MHLISTGRTDVLIDGGLFQGRRDESYQVNTTLSFNPHKTRALILSHAHIDHCGNIPTLIKRGLRCKIYTTAATKDLCRLMLEDSGKIHEEDIRYINKVNRRLGLPLRQCLYTRKEAGKAASRFHPVPYGKRIAVANDITVTMHNAGHILGSALILIEAKDDVGVKRIGYAVDLGRKDLPLIDNPEIFSGLDYLIIESTYGAKLHAPIDQAKIKLRDAITRTIERRGKILIPSFSLERTQEVIYFLNELIREKSIPVVPIYVDSPLATDITDVFKHHVAYLNNKTRQAIEQGNDPFEFLNLTYIRNQDESKKLNLDKRPMIIIAGSGMCESGRILHHLKNNIEDSRNTVLVVGYMAENTLGRKIVDRVPFVRIFGIEYELNAEVTTINAFSGHADQTELCGFIEACLPLKRIFLVHGDMRQTEVLHALLVEKGLDVYIPEKNEEVNFN
jgi:metallo-beta-lactamase family protein